MNKSFFGKILVALLIPFLSCKNDVTDASHYLTSEQDTDWELKNLVGRVKSVTLYKATYLDTGGNKTREPFITFREEFTAFGSVKKTEYFDDFGNLQQTTNNLFDESESLVRTETVDQSRPYRSLMTIEYDTVNNVVTSNVILNDSLTLKYIEEYNKQEQLVRQTSIEQGDTVVHTVKQQFDENDRLLFKEVSPSNDEEPQIFQYKYDSSGNVIESINGDDWMKFKSISEYEGKNLIKRTDYVISADTKEHLREINEYDKYSNLINVKVFEDSKLNREFKNEFKLDKKGNWIKKIVSYKEHFANSKNFTPAYIETREIEYWQ